MVTDRRVLKIRQAERQWIVRQMALSTTLLLAFLIVVAFIFYRQEYSSYRERLEVLTLAVSESVEDEHDVPHFEDSRFLGSLAPDLRGRRFQWLDLEGRVLADKGHLTISNSKLSETGISFQSKPPALVETLLCYDDARPRRPYGYVRVAISLSELEATLLRLAKDLILGLLAGLVLAAWSSRYVAKRALQPLAKAYLQIPQFSADASHELRTPLAAILCNVEVLRESSGDFETDQLMSQLGYIEDAARQMSHLLTSLLTLSRVSEIGLVQVDSIDLGILVEEETSKLEVLSLAREVRLECEADHVRLVGNETLLRSVVRNVVENAVKYTSSGGWVRVRGGRLAKWYLIEVEDNGTGIEQAEVELIFDRFWRSDTARTAGASPGLGLSVVKAVVDAHRGTVEVESRVGVGTTFRVRLPLVPDFTRSLLSYG